MHRLWLIPALAATLLIALSLDVALASPVGETEYDGRPTSSHCEAPTHLSYYDPRNGGQSLYTSAQGAGQGDTVYYVDTNPMAGFHPDGTYSTNPTPEDCQGTPVLRATAYVAVTGTGAIPPVEKHYGYPMCPRSDDRNPDCTDAAFGVQGAFYVGTGNGSRIEGRTFWVTPLP